MKKLALFLVLLPALVINSFAQNNPRPSKSRFWNSKFSTFMLKPGDVLIYSVDDNGQKYDFIATIKSFGETVSYNYSVPDKSEKGTVTIPSNTVKSGLAYSLFTETGKPAGNASLWLSQENFKGLATSAKQTRMDFGAGVDTFSRVSTSTQKIKLKGRERIVTIYRVTSDSGPELWIMNDKDNPLITNINGRKTVTLKEVR